MLCSCTPYGAASSFDGPQHEARISTSNAPYGTQRSPSTTLGASSSLGPSRRSPLDSSHGRPNASTIGASTPHARAGSPGGPNATSSCSSPGPSGPPASRCPTGAWDSAVRAPRPWRGTASYARCRRLQGLPSGTPGFWSQLWGVCGTRALPPTWHHVRRRY